MSLPVDIAKLVDCVDCRDNFSNVESSNVLCEDLILDEHGHEITTGKKLHQHVEKGGILERGKELDHPRTVRLC
jgi:hypothetical protein